MSSANLSLMMYPGLTQGAIAAILVHGTDEQKQTYLPNMVAGTWSGTMNLTEPHCGTDLGLLRTKAVPQGDGTYKISGQKIFISAGEHSMTDNIVHLVLARIEGAPEGTKGISLFIVPKFLVNADGSLGERNGAVCGAIEHKMGIHGNATCVMNYDDATGYLIGAENKGLSAMFVMMNEARLGVGLQGLSIGEIAYQNAANYARDRIQGRSLSGAKHPDKKADPIIVHPDIRRSLLTIRAYNEAGRAFLLWDRAAIGHCTSFDRRGGTPGADDLLGLVTPIVKGVLTDKGFDHAVAAQQVYGGHGYIEEWGMSQYVRDARITMIYEGANGIQALDLVGRKLGLNGGRPSWRSSRKSAISAKKTARTKIWSSTQRPEEGLERSAGCNHVVHAECHGKAGQCRCRLHRLYASLRSGGPRLHACAYGEGGPGFAGLRFFRRGIPEGQARHGPLLHGTPDAGNGAAQDPHRSWQRHDDGARCRSVLTRMRRPHAASNNFQAVTCHREMRHDRRFYL